MMMQIKHRIFFIVIFLLSASYALTQTQQHVSFESSFYASQYKKALDACMHAWGELRMLAQEDHLLPQERDMVVDITLGRLVFADFCAQKMLQDDNILLGDDDISYLLEVASQLQDACDQAAQQLPDDHTACIKQILSSMRTTIETLF